MKGRMLVLLALVLLLGLVIGAMASSGGEASGDVWKDPTSGLTWQILPTGQELGWEQAKTHCDGLNLGGYSDWRLPTISELRSLIRGCPNTQEGGACRLTDSCVKIDCMNDPCTGCAEMGGPGPSGAYQPQELMGDPLFYWSSSQDSDTDVFALGILFGSGHVGPLSVVYAGLARCVR